jgi:hypothetical protein
MSAPPFRLVAKIALDEGDLGPADLWLFPSFDAAGRLQLLPSEEILFTFQTASSPHVEALAPDKRDKYGSEWSLPSTQVIVTAERLVFVCSDYARGARYIGVGLGAPVALIANARSKRRARAASEGTVAAGQLHFENLTGLRAEKDRVRILYSLPDGVKRFLYLAYPKTDVQQFARYLSELVVAYRSMRWLEQFPPGSDLAASVHRAQEELTDPTKIGAVPIPVPVSRYLVNVKASDGSDRLPNFKTVVGPLPGFSLRPTSGLVAPPFITDD